MFRRWLIAGLLLPGAVLAADAPPLPTDLPPGPGADRVQADCGSCHAVKVFTGKKYDAAHWRDVVDQMVDRGAMLADNDYTIILDYLVKNFGPT